MATKVSICNLALRSVGAQRITALTDANEAARVLNDIYDLIRDEVLTAHPWNFASKRASLVAEDDAPEFDYDTAYALPTDCLRVIRMEETDADFKIEAGLLLTDESTANILYIAKITDESKFSPFFVTTLAVRLASEIAYPLTNDQNLAVKKYEEYERKIKMAKSIDGQEGSVETIEDSSWIDDRE